MSKYVTSNVSTNALRLPLVVCLWKRMPHVLIYLPSDVLQDL